MPTHVHILMMLETIQEIVHTLQNNPPSSRDQTTDLFYAIEGELNALIAIVKAEVTH